MGVPLDRGEDRESYRVALRRKLVLYQTNAGTAWSDLQWPALARIYDFGSVFQFPVSVPVKFQE